MSDSSGPVLSVRGDARHTVAPDFAILNTTVSATRNPKAEALRAVARALARLTADLATLGGVPLGIETERRPLTWSAQSAMTYPEHEDDPEAGRSHRTGRIVANVDLLIGVRSFGLLDALGALLATHETLNMSGVSWGVDEDNPAWPAVRAAAIHAAIRKGRDYAAALGGSLLRVEHIADVGLLGGHDEAMAARPLSAFMAQSAFRGGEPDTPSLDPVPQQLTAVIEARFSAAGVTLDTS